MVNTLWLTLTPVSLRKDREACSHLSGKEKKARVCVHVCAHDLGFVWHISFDDKLFETDDDACAGVSLQGKPNNSKSAKTQFCTVST